MNPKQPGVLFAFFLLLLCGMLIWFLIQGEDYYNYVSAAIEQTAAAPVLNKAQITQVATPTQEKFNTDVKFRTFFLTFPGAQKVELQADFNGWGKVPLELQPYSKGYFETSVALGAGEYKYIFVVDGKDVLDPNNLDRIEEKGRTVCIKTVK